MSGPNSPTPDTSWVTTQAIKPSAWPVLAIVVIVTTAAALIAFLAVTHLS